MSDSCRRWEGWLAAVPAVEDAERERHLANCESCREQWLAHQMLGSLGEIPRPELSPDLDRRVRLAVTGPAGESLLSPGARLLMRLYWLLATFGAGVILSQLGSSPTGWLVFWAAVAALGLAGLPVVMALQRRFSWGLMDLVIWTLR